MAEDGYRLSFDRVQQPGQVLSQVTQSGFQRFAGMRLRSGLTNPEGHLDEPIVFFEWHDYAREEADENWLDGLLE